MGKVIYAIVVLTLAMLYLFFVQDNFDPKLLRGKRVLITGASSGIGEQLAYQYAKLGAKLVITARRQVLLEKVAQKCTELGASAVMSVAADMAIPEDRIRVIKETSKHLNHLNFLILNHAIVSNGFWLSSQENMTAVENDFNVNVVATVDLASRAMEMLTESRGSIGVVTSVSGKIGSGRTTSYTATKFALHGFFSSLRQELNFRNAGISITLCVLGPIETDGASEILQREYSHLRPIHPFIPSAESAADAIMRGVSNRVPEVYYNTFAWISVMLHNILPGYVEDFASYILLK